MSGEPLKVIVSSRDKVPTLRELAMEVDVIKTDVAEIAEFVRGISNLKKLVNKWGMGIIAALVTAGVMNGGTAKFLDAMIKVMNGT